MYGRLDIIGTERRKCLKAAAVYRSWLNKCRSTSKIDPLACFFGDCDWLRRIRNTAGRRCLNRYQIETRHLGGNAKTEDIHVTTKNLTSYNLARP